MITHSGVHIQKQGGVEGTPTAMDIAVHAGRICRYGGAVWMPLLAHLVFVGVMAYKRSGSIADLLWGFLHDAHECVTSDVPRPFKCDCMRDEQTAIDARIATRFMQFAGVFVDKKLIKQCDIDALHIEAVTLNLPGFAEVELKYAKDYANETYIHDDAGDQKLFDAIVAGPFYRSTTKGLGSHGVRSFAAMLECAERKDYDAVLEHVRRWGLL